VKWRPVRQRAGLMVETLIRGLTTERKDEVGTAKNEEAAS
jgi:hypothetical protein